ncbi:hypothetical protein L227DRAFT_65038 [Lentinus tigrinus ALCF2SS1-6]|uniref:C2H2-type domain-containing protein n=1 Tax=Lentinus tigrinus ALCF2SS1-6 TaxID=1328759 RepID=A0A5C2SDT5_9APHY|nr:hypothetical protein L227DRAFT_65038 [Lentinus tigrinus ALCF2SS1-6]
MLNFLNYSENDKSDVVPGSSQDPQLAAPFLPQTDMLRPSDGPDTSLNRMLSTLSPAEFDAFLSVLYESPPPCATPPLIQIPDPTWPDFLSSLDSGDTPASSGPFTPYDPTAPDPIQTQCVFSEPPSFSEPQSSIYPPTAINGPGVHTTLPLPVDVPAHTLCGTPYRFPNTTTVMSGTDRSQIDVPQSLAPSRMSRSMRPAKTRLFPCPECDVVIKNRRSNLRQHILENHDPNFNATQCPHCPKSYKRRNDLKKHVALKHLSAANADIRAMYGPSTVNPSN